MTTWRSGTGGCEEAPSILELLDLTISRLRGVLYTESGR